MTAGAAGLLPAITTLHLTGFMAHAVGVPFLICYLVCLHEVCTAPSWSRLVLAAVLLAGTIALYTEFAPLLFALTALAVVAGVILRTLSLVSGAGLLVGLPGLALALNPLYLRILVKISGRVMHPTARSNPLGWLYDTRG